MRCRAAESVKGRDYESVARVQRGDRTVELLPSCPSARDAVVDLEIFTTHAGGEEVGLLTVGVLPASRDPRTPVGLAHQQHSKTVLQPRITSMKADVTCDTWLRDSPA